MFTICPDGVCISSAWLSFHVPNKPLVLSLTLGGATMITLIALAFMGTVAVMANPELKVITTEMIELVSICSIVTPDDEQVETRK